MSVKPSTTTQSAEPSALPASAGSLPGQAVVGSGCRPSAPLLPCDHQPAGNSRHVHPPAELQADRQTATAPRPGDSSRQPVNSSYVASKPAAGSTHAHASPPTDLGLPPSGLARSSSHSQPPQPYSAHVSANKHSGKWPGRWGKADRSLGIIDERCLICRELIRCVSPDVRQCRQHM